MKTNKKMSKGKILAVGAGLAAVGAGAYYLAGPNGKKNQEKIKALAGKLKKDGVRVVAKAKKDGSKVLVKAKKEIKVVKNKAASLEKLAVKTLKSLNR
jgi:hypothetical protein